MTLGRQLFLAFFLLITLVIVGAFVISLTNTRAYLATQLESNAQNAALSLGMSLSAIIAEDDPEVIAGTADSLFDGGDYQQIKVQSVNGKTAIDLRAPLTFEGIPDWFIDLMFIESPPMTSLVVDGLVEWGRVEIRSNPAYAYQQLWQSFVDNLMLALFAIIVTIIIVAVLLRVMLTPLKSIEGQANAISNREFPIQSRIPTTLEFRSVVNAMNKMTRKVLQMFEEQTMVAENLRKETYTDSLTGLGNRRSLMMRLQLMTNENDDTRDGALVLLKLVGLEQINRDYNYTVGNEIITRIGEELLTNTDSQVYLTRTGSDFAMIIKHKDEKAVEALAAHLITRLSALRFSDAEQIDFHLGIACYSGSETHQKLFSMADMALRKAQQKGPRNYQLYRQDDRLPVKSGEQWRQSLQKIIEHRSIELVFQPQQMFGLDQISDYEVLARFVDNDGNNIVAGTAFPMAERYQLASALDRVIIELLLTELQRPWAREKSVTINLSMQSVQDLLFQQWLEKQVVSNPTQAEHLMIEITEQQFLGSRDEFTAFMLRFRPYGVSFSIDQFGINSSAFGYLSSLKLNQLKIDGSFISGLHDNMDNQFFIRSLTEIAHNLEIKIVANFVETDDELQKVKVLGMDGAQGYLIGKPQVMSSEQHI